MNFEILEHHIKVYAGKKQAVHVNLPFTWQFQKTTGLLYKRPGTRGTAAPRAFLKGYKGTLVTDGYHVYHTMAKERSFHTWAEVAAEAVKRIAVIYHVDYMYEKSSDEERADQRKNSVKPLVDAYFE